MQGSEGLFRVMTQVLRVETNLLLRDALLALDRGQMGGTPADGEGAETEPDGRAAAAAAAAWARPGAQVELWGAQGRCARTMGVCMHVCHAAGNYPGLRAEAERGDWAVAAAAIAWTCLALRWG